MRCKRCHATISEGRKSCPNCGTLIRKKRGSITLSSQSGVDVNPFADWINDTVYNIKMAVRRDSRILILMVAVPLVILGAVLLISCGASSCSCSCSCDSGRSAKIRYQAMENSREPSLQCAVGDTLYYVAEGTIMSRSGDETYRSIYNSISATDLQSDGKYLYFREGNVIKRIENGKTYVSGDNSADTVLDFSSDENFTLGYFVAEGKVYYYLREEGSEFATLYSDGPVFSGAADEFGYMKGRIYYTVSATDASYDICSVNTDGTDTKTVVREVQDYQLGGGYIYAVVADSEGIRYLVRYDEAGKELAKWNIGAMTGGELSTIAANDTWVCIAVDLEKGSVVYRLEHNTTDIAVVFPFSDRIRLTGVSGDWYAFESTATDEDGKTTVDYSIRNSRNGKSAM